MLRLKSMLAPALVVALGISAAAHADDADLAREAAARAEIEALMWRYVRALDSLDAEAYAEVFTEDGQFGTGENAVAGRAALRSMVEGLRDGRAEDAAPMYHVITNSHIELLGNDRARYHSYWMTVFGAAGQGSAPRVAAAGRGVDELVRVDGEWLIRSRDVAPTD